MRFSGIINFLGLIKKDKYDLLKARFDALHEEFTTYKYEIWLKENTYEYKGKRYYKIGDTSFSYELESSTIHWCGEHGIASSTCTVNKLYSGMCDLFDNINLMDHSFPMRAKDRYEYRIISGASITNEALRWLIDLDRVRISGIGETILYVMLT